MAAGLDISAHITSYVVEGRAPRPSSPGWAGGDARRSTSELRSFSGLHLLANILWLTIVGWQT